MLACGLMIAQVVAAKALRDSVFLSVFPPSALPAITIAAAAFAIAASMAGARLMNSLTPAKMVPLAFFASALFQVGERSLYLVDQEIAACVIYLHVFALNLVLTSAFWSLMNEHFDPRSAQKSFGRIAGVGTLGGILGGLLAARSAAWGSIPALILSTAALHFACGVTLWRFAQKFARAEPAQRPAQAALRATLTRSPFLIELAALVVAVSIAAGLLDFVFKSQAVDTIGKGPALTRFFAWFYTATALLGMLVQTLATPAILARFGLASAVSSLPASVMIVGGGSVLLALNLAGVTLLRGWETIIRNSLFRSGYELFYTPVAPEDKRTAKGIIDVGGERLGDALGGGIVALLLWLNLGGNATILTIAVAFSCAGLLLTRRLGRSYVQVLEGSLARQAQGAGPTSDEVEQLSVTIVPHPPRVSAAPQAEDDGHAALLRRHPAIQELLELRSGDESRVVRALRRIQEPTPLICHQLIQLLANDTYAFLAMEKLRLSATRHAGQLADALLNPDEPFVTRRRLPLILAASESQRALDALVEALTDLEFQVRYRSACAIDQLRLDHPWMAFPAERVWGVLTAELQVSRDVWERRRLATAETIGRAAPESPGEASIEYLFALLRLLLPRDPVSMAFRALGTDDRRLRGTALEYLQTVLPSGTWQLLEDLIANRIVGTTSRPGA